MNHEPYNVIRLLLLAVLVCSLFSCNKYAILPDLKIGESYRIDSDVFNKGTYQPNCPCRLDSLYIDKTGEPMSSIRDLDGVEWYVPQSDLRR